MLGDRTQAPSGAGFALENRVATSRIYSDLYSEAHVHRLAGFFRSFREALQGLSDDRDARVAILTPGPLNDTYFEHAYIARYLGFTLLEGEDLTVENGRVMVRTVAGLRPVTVLWRRLDAAFADPLELDATSRLGTPGLVGAARQGSVTLVNALGSGVLETRALLAFMPRIARALLGEPLILPNIATWWCGQPAERAHVRAHRERMMIGPALSTRLPFEPDDATILGSRFRPGAAGSFEAWLDADGPSLVGQESVMLSTTPAFVDGRLLPRPMSLRVFLARTPHGWQVMQGGFARIGQAPEPSAIGMQHGGTAADVWVVSPRRVETVTMLPAAAGPYSRVRPGVLPSRAGDNLYWLGRYVERAEGAMRLVRAYHVRLAETADPEAPLADYFADYLDSLGLDPEEPVPPALAAMLDSAIVSAGCVRDRFSVDGWSALNDLAKTTRRLAERVTPGRRRRPRHERAAAQDLGLLRPRAREHVPLHRLAVPVDRPQPRMRDVDGRRARLARRPRRPRRRPRPRDRGRRQRDVAPAPLRADHHPRDRRRPARPRRHEPARGALPAQRDQGARRLPAGRRGQRPALAPRRAPCCRPTPGSRSRRPRPSTAPRCAR